VKKNQAVRVEKCSQDEKEAHEQKLLEERMSCVTHEYREDYNHVYRKKSFKGG